MIISTVRTDMQKGQSALKRRIEANKRDCAAKPNYSFTPPVVSGALSQHMAEIRRELVKVAV